MPLPISPISPAKDDASKAPLLAQVRGFRIPARRLSPASGIADSLSGLPLLKVVPDFEDPDTLLALNVESRDIQNNPLVFSIVYFRPDAIDVLYTQLPSASPKLRKLNMLKYALNLLTLNSRNYSLDARYLYQLLEGTISELDEYVSSDYQKLFSSYDNLKSRVGDLEKKAKSLSDSNAALSKDNYEIKGRNEELQVRIQQVERYSDAVLAVKIQEWLSEHNNEINLSEFGKVHGVSEARVEQVLNQLVSEGYLENR
ncbi:MAG: hypothetical protein V1728_04200 [Candidatus Micrarchaeota archaeon]